MLHQESKTYFESLIGFQGYYLPQSKASNKAWINSLENILSKRFTEFIMSQFSKNLLLLACIGNRLYYEETHQSWNPKGNKVFTKGLLFLSSCSCTWGHSRKLVPRWVKFFFWLKQQNFIISQFLYNMNLGTAQLDPPVRVSPDPKVSAGPVTLPGVWSLLPCSFQCEQH